MIRCRRTRRSRCDRVVFIRFEQIDVVALLQILQWERPAGQEFVEEPQASGILAGRLGPDMDKEVFLRSLLKQDAEDRRIRPVILEREFEMVAECVPGQYFGG